MNNFNEQFTIQLTVVCKTIATIAAIIAALLLAQDGKDGWGWFIFLAVILGSFSLIEKKHDSN